MTQRVTILLLATAVSALLAAGQVFLKQALSLAPPGAGIGDLLRTVLVSWRAWAAVTATGSAAVLWLKVLAGAELSLIYPMISLSYVFGLLAAGLFLGEQVSIARWGGVILICAGVGLLNWR